MSCAARLNRTGLDSFCFILLANHYTILRNLKRTLLCSCALFLSTSLSRKCVLANIRTTQISCSMRLKHFFGSIEVVETGVMRPTQCLHPWVTSFYERFVHSGFGSSVRVLIVLTYAYGPPACSAKIGWNVLKHCGSPFALLRVALLLIFCQNNKRH